MTTKKAIAERLDALNPLFNFSVEKGACSYKNYTLAELYKIMLQELGLKEGDEVSERGSNTEYKITWVGGFRATITNPVTEYTRTLSLMNFGKDKKFVF